MIRKSMKFMTVIIVVCMVSTAAAYASGRHVTIDEAVQIGIENQKDQAELREIRLEELKINYDEAVRRSPTTNILTYGSNYQRYVTPLVAQKAYEMAKMQHEDANRVLANNVYKQALQLILTYKNLDYLQDLLSIDRERLRRAKLSYQAEQITYASLLSSRYTVESREDSIKDLEFTLERRNMDFKRLLELPLDAEDLVIDRAEFAYSALGQIDLESVIKNVLENDSGMYSREMDVKIQQKVMEITEQFFEDDQIQYWQNLYNYKNAEYNLKQQKVNAEYNIRVSYNHVLSRYNKVVLAKQLEEIRRISLNQARERYNRQIANWSSYASALTSFWAARYSRYSAEYQYMVALADFEFLIGE